MLILTRYNNQRIVVIAPDKSDLWITSDYDGLWIFEPVGDPSFIESLSSASFDVSGQKVVVTYLNRYGKVRTTHRIGIDAPKDYLILREELLTREEK